MSIIVACHVLADGSGDYFHSKAAAEILSKAFPDRRITLICSIDRLKKESRSFPPPEERNIETIIADEEDSNEYLASTSKVSEIVRNAVAFVNGPYGACRLIHYEQLRCEQFSYSEYGRGDHATGLRANDYGIVIKDPPQIQELSALEDAPLRAFLNPEANLCYAYLNANATHLDCHLQGYILAACSMHATTKKPLDIVCSLKMMHEKNWRERIQKKMDESSPDEHLNIARSFGGFSHKNFDFTPFKQLGIQNLQLFHKNTEGNFTLVEQVALNEQGKTVRLIHPFPLSPSDVLLLNSLSDFVGATGDMSLTEAISCSKPFFYQILYHHKGIFFRSLHDLVNQLFPPGAAIAQFFDQMRAFQPGTTPDTFDFGAAIECGRLAALPETRHQFEELCRDIRKNHCFNQVLIEKVSKQIRQILR